jgi:uncharacterized protein YjbI with pentapeptide repeats
MHRWTVKGISFSRYDDGRINQTTMRVEARSKGRITIRDDQCVVLDHARLDGEDYSGRTLLQFASIGSHLHACNFDKVRIQSAAFGSGRETSEFVDCTFNGARMNMAPGGFSRFVRCSFHNVNIRDWICLTVEMIDCKFSGRLETAIFNGTVPEDDVPPMSFLEMIFLRWIFAMSAFEPASI